MNTEIQSINLQLLCYQPDRRDMGDLKALAASIREQGVIVPLIIRKMNYEADTPVNDGVPRAYFIIDGRRRYEAARLAGLTEVPCIVRDVAQDGDNLPQLTDDLSLIANTHRLNLSPMELHAKARLAAGIDPEKALTALDPAQGKQLAALLNLSLRDTQRIIALGLCPKAVQDMVHDRAMPVSIALLTVGLDEKKAAGFLEHYRSVRPGYQDAKRWLEANQATKSLRYAPFDTKGCAGCPHREGSKAPVLFEDPGKDEAVDGYYCFKPSCWQEKYRAAKQAVKDIAAKLGVPKARVNMGGTYYGEKQWEYSPAKVKDPAKCAECKLVTMGRDGKKWVPYCESSCANRKDVKRSPSGVEGERQQYLSPAAVGAMLDEGKPVPPGALKQYFEDRLDEAAGTLFKAVFAGLAPKLPIEKLPQVLHLDHECDAMRYAFDKYRLGDNTGDEKETRALLALDTKRFWAALLEGFRKEVSENLADDMSSVDYVARVLLNVKGWCAANAKTILMGLDKHGVLAAAALGKHKHPLLGEINFSPRPKSGEGQGEGPAPAAKAAAKKAAPKTRKK